MAHSVNKQNEIVENKPCHKTREIVLKETKISTQKNNQNRECFTDECIFYSKFLWSESSWGDDTDIKRGYTYKIPVIQTTKLSHDIYHLIVINTIDIHINSK